MKQLILQFVILRPLTAWAAIGLTFFDLLGDGELAWNRGFLYIGIVNNISVTVSRRRRACRCRASSAHAGV